MNEEIILKVENLSVGYGKKQVLNNVSLTVKQNAITALIGQSGCGKSTLLKTLNLISQEEGAKISGTISFLGKDINSMEKEAVRKEIGMVFQQPIAFPMSIFENVAFALRYHHKYSKNELMERVNSCLKEAKLYDEVKDDIQQSALKLSGGQKQRLSIARQLAVMPKILMLDEPCSALDIKNTLMIEELLNDIKQKCTVIIVTHNLAQARRISDNIIFMDNGSIVEGDNSEKFFSCPETELAKEYIQYMEV